MKSYPSIPKEIRRDIHIYAFDKIDGSNIRAEWTRKNGFYKFGSKGVLLHESHKDLGTAIQLIRDKYEDDLNRIYKKQRYDRVICFFEFFGLSSFAGQHANEQHDVVLIDVNPHKKGIIEPREFLKIYGDLDIPRVLHSGKANKEFEAKVRNSSLEDMTLEGVVCKGNNPRKPNHRLMFKIKSDIWLERLREFCAGNVKLFEELA